MIHVKDIKKLYQVFQNDDIDKIEIRNGDDKLSFSITPAPQKKGGSKSSAQVVEAAPQPTPAEAAQASEDRRLQNLYEMKSKWIGFFIRLNPKTAENYVKLRDVVKKGDTVGHVRVLGVLQDLKAEQDGKLKEVLVEEGQPVEYGQPVMRFEIQK